MPRDPRFDPLFEPLKIGPVTAPNRFWQVPHCSGMGNLHPQTLAAMRGVKAEGGWGVVNSEYCSIHPTSDDTPAPYASLWDAGDVANMAAMAEAVHGHGALAGVELWHGGARAGNLLSREAGMSPESLLAEAVPWQSQRMDRTDIANLRRWHRDAALRAKAAGFDVVYVYAAHSYLLAQFLDAAQNPRRDDYGGAFANRSRIVREILADTRDAVGDKMAVALRIEVMDEDGGGQEERAAFLGQIKGLVDVFDVTIPDYALEMGASRFGKEAGLEAHVRHIRRATGKPVVIVGRFTSPETMLSQLQRGVLDFIGAARPSIADPFLPLKIREGRLDDIRECIGCNICYAHDGLAAPIRCTQNPTMGEEWRRGWHPEQVPALHDADHVLIVGAGPAGLEAALTLGRRGVPVLLAEAGEPGGRVTLEAGLPGLAEWARVRDWRLHQLSKLLNVQVFPGSKMSVADVLATDVKHVMVATGSLWRRDGRGRSYPGGVASYDDARTLTPDQVLGGKRPQGPVVIFDDEGYHIAAGLALQGRGLTSLHRIGDARAPGLIAHAVHDGHRFARAHLTGETVKRERVVIGF